MKATNVRRSPQSPRVRRAVGPLLESLEGRLLMYSTTGNHFDYGSRITWSIEPDGTNLGGVSSNLVSSLNQKFGAGNWLQSIQDAFAVWENVANINTVQVGDNGAATNSGNYQQGSPYFGDIRIGGFGLDPSVLGFAMLPPPGNGGSSSGDIFLNSNQLWQIGNDYDLESVMIHEIGHALGMGHSADATASMYAYYHGVQQNVKADDIAGIQSIWAPRQEDWVYNTYANSVAGRAAGLNQFVGSNNQVYLGPLDLAKSSSSYWFKVTTPSNASNQFQALIQSTNLSELSPKVTVYDANLNGLGFSAAPANAYGTIVQYTIYNATPNTTYYIKVSASNVGPTGTGAYALLVNMSNTNLVLIPPPNTQSLAKADQGGGSTAERVFGQDPPALPGSSVASTVLTTVGPVAIGPVGVVQSVATVVGLTVGPAGDGPIGHLGDWENVHTFAGATHSGGGPSPVDPLETLQVGSQAYAGDRLLTTPAPQEGANVAPVPVVIAPVLIPLEEVSDRTTAVKRGTTATFVNHFHPAGPL